MKSMLLTMLLPRLAPCGHPFGSVRPVLCDQGRGGLAGVGAGGAEGRPVGHRRIFGKGGGL